MSYYTECAECGAHLNPGEQCDFQAESKNAIRCTQAPIISENLLSVRDRLDALLADISVLPRTEESLKYIRQTRANLNRDFEQLEVQRKAVKKQVLAPYEAAEAKYKELVSDPYKAADSALKNWVDTYQNELKQAREDELRSYFDELCAANGIDFFPFSRCGVAVDMAMARQKEPRKAMDQIYNTVMSIRADMDSILSMDHADEIMAEYRKYPVLSEAVRTVHTRRQDADAVKAYICRQKEQKQERDASREKILASAPELADREEVCTVSFTATGPISALKAMKAYALGIGITFSEKQED